uniref:ELMO domain-containing protein n=1 Tax=Elaeophora elaphi TaxID=1147741 RepID=A0A0R3RGE9_9BILA
MSPNLRVQKGALCGMNGILSHPLNFSHLWLAEDYFGQENGLVSRLFSAERRPNVGFGLTLVRVVNTVLERTPGKCLKFYENAMRPADQSHNSDNDSIFRKNQSCKRTKIERAMVRFYEWIVLPIIFVRLKSSPYFQFDDMFYVIKA